MSNRKSLITAFIVLASGLFGMSAFGQGNRVQHLHQLDCADGEVPQFNAQSWTCGATGPTPTTDPFPESNLLSSPDQLMINEWIGNPNQQWRRCFATSVDGTSSQTFHNQCNFRGPTVSIIQFDNGMIAGGYTETGRSFFGFVTATNAFLFSLTNGNRYPITNPSFATFNHPNHGPTFGQGHDIFVGPDMTTGSCHFPVSYGWQGQSQDPNNPAATQELCGINPGSVTNILEIEVFVYQDQ